MLTSTTSQWYIVYSNWNSNQNKIVNAVSDAKIFFFQNELTYVKFKDIGKVIENTKNVKF